MIGWIALAGAIGAMSRYLLDLGLGRLLPPRLRQGWALVVVNVLGSFAIGIAAGATTLGLIDPRTDTVLATGFLGGFTTFSAASLDIVQADRRIGRDHAIAMAVTVALGAIGACALGVWLGSRL
ncbi:fluoride efflux transporter FluC [Serinibacter salmoneus]|uniref:Fluoride-specific ion channel FluC n=1 Tax=Serinibacter salmoneus TaxID=556530 RepID=A0A2A9CWJ4_9MICO|nr:CrcB family protein [Serinibacter salmoneus]PFG18794.1 camphor resistance protein CrcB [Serinibacter salmoneus]